jgi:hypothetical protein
MTLETAESFAQRILLDEDVDQRPKWIFATSTAKPPFRSASGRQEKWRVTLFHPERVRRFITKVRSTPRQQNPSHHDLTIVLLLEVRSNAFKDHIPLVEERSRTEAPPREALVLFHAAA